MASITQNKKDGKVVSYKFKACVGRDELGKQVLKCSTWKVPEGLIPSRVEKAAQKAAADWEKEILGHTNASTTLNFYVRSDVQQMKAATDKFANAFGL